MRWNRVLRAISLLIGLSILFGLAPAVHGDDLVELQLVTKGRRYSPESPLDQVEQEFAVTAPGMLTVDYVADKYESQNGGYYIAPVDGSSLYLGREAVREITPPDGPKFQEKYTLHQVIIVSEPIDKRLSAGLVAFHVCQAMQVCESGDQLPASMQLKVSFAPLGQGAQQAGPPPAVDVTGVWRWDAGSGQTLTFIPRGNGIYDTVDTDCGNPRGVARVSGRSVTVDYKHTTPCGSATSGTFYMTVLADGEHMSGGWLYDDGENGVTSLTRVSATVPTVAASAPAATAMPATATALPPTAVPTQALTAAATRLPPTAVPTQAPAATATSLPPPPSGRSGGLPCPSGLAGVGLLLVLAAWSAGKR